MQKNISINFDVNWKIFWVSLTELFDSLTRHISGLMDDWRIHRVHIDRLLIDRVHFEGRVNFNVLLGVVNQGT